MRNAAAYGRERAEVPTPRSHHASDVLNRQAFRLAVEAFVRWLVYLSGWVAIVILAGIMVFLISNSIQALDVNGLWAMLKGDAWFPTGTPESFGFLPSIVGSAWVTLVAVLVSVPVGLATAVFISELAGDRVKDIAKSVIELMSAVPSVVVGMVGIYFGVPFVKETLGLSTGLTALTAGLFVGLMALPTIVSISEDALNAVPDALRMGSAALGNTRWQTTCKVVLPAASSGIFAAVMLGLGRAIGETMVVLMLAGNSGLITKTPFDSVRTLPGTIANEMGEVVQGGLHYSTLFAMGLVLFAITFVINVAADVVLQKQRARWRP